MNLADNVFDFNDRIIFGLRSLYSKYGYSRYKMRKFEEYDYYSENKSFLVSDGIITFTDRSGKLLALKPDVTLSIIKNTATRPQGTEKLFYNENVYRVDKGSQEFREIMQVGLECIGKVDSYCVSEVLFLAAESLKAITDNWILEIGNLDIINSLVNKIAPTSEIKRKIMECVTNKNIHGINEILANYGIKGAEAEFLKEFLSISGGVEVIESVTELAEKAGLESEAKQIKSAISIFSGYGLESNIRIDFSVTGDTRYYNGIVFRGFVEGAPEFVLSGGQYDALLKRMKKKSNAIGFAVYLDKLNMAKTGVKKSDVDVIIAYEEGSSSESIMKEVQKYIAEGLSVKTVSLESLSNMQAKKIVRITK